MKEIISTVEKLKALPVSAAILDPSGRIVAVNDTWKEFGRRNGLRIPNSAVGASYLRYCGSAEQPSRFALDLRELLAGRRDLLTLVYPCHSATKQRWFSLIGLPLSSDKPAGVALLHVNLTDTIPLPFGAAKPGRSGPARRPADLDAIGGAVERSVSATLDAQLKAMLEPRRESGPARRERRQILAGAGLSRRQEQVLRLLGTGKTNKEIANLLVRSPNTIKLHVSAILQRLKLRSRTQAALLASRLYSDEPIGSAESSLRSWKRAGAPARQRAARPSRRPSA